MNIPIDKAAIIRVACEELERRLSRLADERDAAFAAALPANRSFLEEAYATQTRALQQLRLAAEALTEAASMPHSTVQEGALLRVRIERRGGGPDTAW